MDSFPLIKKEFILAFPIIIKLKFLKLYFPKHDISRILRWLFSSCKPTVYNAKPHQRVFQNSGSQYVTWGKKQGIEKESRFPRKRNALSKKRNQLTQEDRHEKRQKKILEKKSLALEKIQMLIWWLLKQILLSSRP